MISVSPASEHPGIRAESRSDQSRGPTPVAGAERPESEAEYRQRMRLNLFGAIAVIVLIGVGILLVNAMVETEKEQGCYSSGQHTCSLI
jgi:hypothetical protein